MTAIDSFSDLKGLVLDLRGNPGGLLSQAVEVCDHLLAKGQCIVSQRGRAYPDQNYTATHGNDGKTVPDRGAGKSQHRLGRGDRQRRTAGSRPRPDRGGNYLRQRVGADGL